MQIKKPFQFAALTLIALFAADSGFCKQREAPLSQMHLHNVKNVELTTSGVALSDGRSVRLTWPRYDFGQPRVKGWLIQRAEGDGKWEKIAEVGIAETTYVDRNLPGALFGSGGRRYRYRTLGKLGGDWTMPYDPTGFITPKPRWFDPKRANVFAVIIVYFGSVLTYIYRTRRGKSLFVRRIAGMDAADEAIGRATEMGRPALYIPGIMDVDNIQTIASMVILTEVARKAAVYDTPIIVPLNRAFVVPLAEEAVAEGFMRAGRIDAFNPNNIRYLSDEQFAFTAGVAGIMNREKTAAHFFLGAFFAESLILSEVGFAAGAIQIAGTANVHQLPFFVVACDYTLIGEEFYAASAYISKDPQLLGTLKGADLVKAALMMLILIGSILAWAGLNGVANFFGV